MTSSLKDLECDCLDPKGRRSTALRGAGVERRRAKRAPDKRITRSAADRVAGRAW
jgi:hypothetical protein